MHHQSGLTLAGLSDLTPGTNKGQALLCRPLVFLAPPLNASATLWVESCLRGEAGGEGLCTYV